MSRKRVQLQQISGECDYIAQAPDRGSRYQLHMEYLASFQAECDVPCLDFIRIRHAAVVGVEDDSIVSGYPIRFQVSNGDSLAFDGNGSLMAAALVVQGAVSLVEMRSACCKDAERRFLADRSKVRRKPR